MFDFQRINEGMRRRFRKLERKLERQRWQENKRPQGWIACPPACPPPACLSQACPPLVYSYVPTAYSMTHGTRPAYPSMYQPGPPMYVAYASGAYAPAAYVLNCENTYVHFR